MVDQHLLTTGDIEFGINEAFDQVPGQIEVSSKGRQSRDSPSFVGVLVRRGRADGKCRHFVKKEI
jgi:hypothetical protein